MCVSPQDPLIVKVLDQPASSLGTSGGSVEAQPVLVDTPFGPFEGVASHGSPRLLPGGWFRQFRRIKRVCLRGVCYDLCWKDDVPVLCGPGTPDTQRKTSTVSLRADSAVTGSKRRKIARRRRKQWFLPFEEDPVDDVAGADGSRRISVEAPTPVYRFVGGEESTRDARDESASPSCADGDVCRVLEFSEYEAEFDKCGFGATLRKHDPLLHKYCTCEFCKIAKKQSVPQLRKPANSWAPEYLPGDLVIADLCTDWHASREQETIALIMRDVASDLLFVKGLKGKVPEGVKAGLNEFRELLAEFRERAGMPAQSERPWILHTDRGGEFVASSIAKYVAEHGGVHKLAPKGAHVSAAESTVREVLQGARVTLFAAGLSAAYWPYACRQYVHNHNCLNPAYVDLMRSTGRPHERMTFGALVFFKPDEDEKQPKGQPTSAPGCFLGFDTQMRRGVWVAFYRQSGNLGLTTVDLGRTGHGLTWAEPGSDGLARMAFKRVVQELRTLTVPSKEGLKHGAPGMSQNEMEAWIEANPPPKRVVEPSSSCPACRGRNRAHTYEGTCMLVGLTEVQRSEFKVWARGKSKEQQMKRLASYREANASAMRRAAARKGAQKAHATATQAPCAASGAKSDASAMRRTDRKRMSLEPATLEEYDMCGNIGVSSCGCSYGSCRKNYAIAVDKKLALGSLNQGGVHPSGSPEVAQEEPDPEPPMTALAKATLECGTAARLEELCMENSLSPAEFARASNLPRADGENAGYHALAAVLPPTRRAYVTRKMTKIERSGPGRGALKTEVLKLCKHGLYGEPEEEDAVAAAHPDATVSAQVMLGHVKHAERPGSEEYKGRAVVRGDDVRMLVGNGKPVMPTGVEVGQVARLEEVRAVAAYAAMTGRKKQKVDLENAYLNAKFHVPGGGDLYHYLRLPHEIWQHFPKGLQPNGLRRPLWRMLKAGYGHELSGHLFIMMLKSWLLANGFKLIDGTAALFERGTILLAVYVDDLLACGEDSELAAFWESLGAAFTFKADPAPCDEFLGIDFSYHETETHREWRLSMSAYILDTIREYEKLWGTTVRPSKTPGSENVRAFNKAKSTALSAPRPAKDLQSIVGRLLWICRTARPDLSHMSSAFGSRVLTWDHEVDQELAKTIGYLLVTHSAHLAFRWPRLASALSAERMQSVIFTDADWVEPRSQSGMLCAFTTGSHEDAALAHKPEGTSDPEVPDEVPRGFLPVHWGSRKQPLASDSSTSAEIIAAHYGIKEGFPIMSALGDFLERQRLCCKLTPTLRVDNLTCLKHVNKSYTDTWYAYSKACAVRITFLSDLRIAGVIAASHVRTSINPADVFTKAFSGTEFAGRAVLTGLVYPASCAVHRFSATARALRGRLWRRRAVATLRAHWVRV